MVQLAATWTVEILACGVAIASLAGIISTLAVMDGSPVLSWHKITLNTVISILATASKLSAMFALGAAIAQSKWTIFSKSPRSLVEFEAVDKASKGVSGAVGLLIRTRSIALIGSIAIILAVAFDPFMQQLVQLYSDTVPDNSVATIPRAQRYSAGHRSWVGTSELIADADYSMKAAITYGLAGSEDNITKQTPFTCPSGNCTFPATRSMAVCSLCNDLGSKLRTSSTIRIPTLKYLAAQYLQPPAMVTRFELANDLWIDNIDDQNASLLATTRGTSNPNETMSMQSVDTLVWSMTILRVAGNSSETWPRLPVEAKECALYYCVREYQATVQNNNFQQTSREVKEAKRDPKSWQEIAEEPAPLVTNDFAFNEPIDMTDLRVGNDFNVSQTATFGIGTYMTECFNADFSHVTSSSVETAGDTDDSNDSGDTGQIKGFYMGGDSMTKYQPAALAPLHDSPSLETTFRNIAASMSNAIRIGADNHTTQVGVNQVQITKYRIVWPWIALPSAVILATIAQLILSIKENRKTPLWKGSTLATLSRGRFVGGLLDEASTVKDMKQAVQQHNVHLFAHTAALVDDEFMEDVEKQTSSSPTGARPTVHITPLPVAFSAGRRT